MAEAFLQIVLDSLNSLIQKKIGLLWGVDKELEKLSSTLSTIQAVLEDAEEKQVKDKAIRNWLRKLKDAAYKVDDILDECATEASRLESKGQYSRSINKVHASFLTCFPFHPDNILFRHKIGSRIREVREGLDEIAEERMKFHLHEVVAERRVEITERRQTGSIITQPQVYGRDEDKERIVEHLVNYISNCDDVSVYPIVGIGGLGKTTLAQLVFNDERVRRHFEPRIWVCVSEDFNARRVIKAIIESATGVACQPLDLDPLQKRLQDILWGKKYLLILDDVWNEDQEKWERLKYVLACGLKGASIIATTRIKRVASIMGTLPEHDLSGLSEDDCWSLFTERAFGRDREEHPNIVAIGKEIVRKCGGVPLAAKALGSLMRYKSGENEWLFVKESELWNLPQDENSVLLALRLSYSNLPLQLRQCFAYCAVFPKDCVIDREDLIHLWMANGFISSNGKLELEDIGNEICNELYWRSLIEVAERDNTGNKMRFKMHDLVHDLAQSVMEDECCIIEAESSINISRRTHHVTFVTYLRQLFTIPQALYGVDNLRTFRVQPIHTKCSSVKSPSEFSCDFLKLCSLRVLCARRTIIPKLSSSISNLKHLRYLDLSSTCIQVLPKSVCRLFNLQTLKLVNCVALQGLPKKTSHLKNLRHLYLNGCFSLKHMPPKIGHISCLKTLTLFIVGKRKGCQLAELQGLNLGGELCIKHLERVSNLMDAKKANLVGKRNLRYLCLSWGRDNEIDLQENVDNVLEALEPHPNLEHLVIEEFKGTHFPVWMRDPTLNNVVSIRLSNCKNCFQLPPLWQLPSLQHLEVLGMNNVLYIDHNLHGGGTVRGFPSLKSLRISDLQSLERLSREEGRELFPCLSLMYITNCPKLALPCLPSLKNLQVRDCNEVVLNSISNLKSLTSLSVFNNDEVIYLPHGMLQNLTSLYSLTIENFSKLKGLPTELVNLTALSSLFISECHEFESFPEQGLQGLKSLQCLHVQDCSKLKSLSEGLQHLTTLERLILDGCPELEAFPAGIRHLSSLQHLTMSGQPTAFNASEIFQGNPIHFSRLMVRSSSSGNPIACPKLGVLPETLQHVPSLQSLSIFCYPVLASLPDWLGNLTSLQSLQIFSCAKLTSLPTSIQRLTKLQTLDISQCPELVKRCAKETGEDWCKIAHVPNVNLYTLPQTEVQNTNCCIQSRGVMRY